VGKTGAGKSKLLNEILGDHRIFKSQTGIESCTDKVECSEWRVVKSKIETTTTTTAAAANRTSREVSYELMAFDTPGIGDTLGRSKQFLNDIAETIKIWPLNLLIILVEYGRLDVGLYNNLEVMRECLNELSQYSSMLVVNKVPTERALERKRRQGEQVPNRDELLNETFAKLSQALGNEFTFKIFLENEDNSQDAEAFNRKQYDFVRQLIFSRNFHLNVFRVKTWDEIVDFYREESQTDREVQRQLEELVREAEAKLDKLEFDIADIKYSFLDNRDKLTGHLPGDLVEFVTHFECHLTREKYYELLSRYSSEFVHSLQIRMNVALDNDDEEAMTRAHAIPTELLWEYFFRTEVDDKLMKLSARRTLYLIELSRCQGSIEEREKMLNDKKAKIARLENALVNPNQGQD